MKLQSLKTLRARFTKQVKLAPEHNSKTASVGVEIYAGGFTDNTQIKKHRRNISFTRRPTQYTKHSAN